MELKSSPSRFLKMKFLETASIEYIENGCVDGKFCFLDCKKCGRCICFFKCSCEQNALHGYFCLHLHLFCLRKPDESFQTVLDEEEDTFTCDDFNEDGENDDVLNRSDPESASFPGGLATDDVELLQAKECLFAKEILFQKKLSLNNCEDTSNLAETQQLLNNFVQIAQNYIDGKAPHHKKLVEKVLETFTKESKKSAVKSTSKVIIRKRKASKQRRTFKRVVNKAGRKPKNRARCLLSQSQRDDIVSSFTQ